MASRYERAANLVQQSVESHGESNDYHVIIGLMRDAHAAAKEGWTVEQLLDSLASRVEDAYILDDIKFDEGEAVPAE